MRLTTKGQVTIPLAMRRALGLEPWTEVDFELDGDSVRIRRRVGTKRRGERLLQALAAAPRPKRGMTTDQLMALTRGD